MTNSNQKNTKLSTLILLLLVLLLFILGVFYVLSNNKKPKPVINTNNNQQIDNEKSQSVITNQNEYINYKYNFGLSFPNHWKGFKAVEKDGIVEFSLQNRSKEYIPIFTIGMYYNNEFIKLIEQSSPEPKPTAIDTKDDFTTAYLMKRNDQNLSEFGGIYSETDYMKPYFDVQNNIIPTLKFIKKGEIFNEKNKFQKDNEFKLAKVKVGDVIAGMKVKFIKTSDGEYIQSTVGHPPSIYNLSIGFSGETTIMGTYHNDGVDIQTGFGGQVCFDDLDEQSKDKIPSFEWNDRYIRFCFSNQELAKEIFKPEGNTGTATIVIDDYSTNENPRLVKVVSKD
jgi:hypothetical protein